MIEDNTYILMSHTVMKSHLGSYKPRKKWQKKAVEYNSAWVQDINSLLVILK